MYIVKVNGEKVKEFEDMNEAAHYAKVAILVNLVLDENVKVEVIVDDGLLMSVRNLPPLNKLFAVVRNKIDDKVFA